MYGLGLLLTAAVEAWAHRVVVGLGGSATNDGGAGMLTALGATRWTGRPSAAAVGGGALVGQSRRSTAPRGCAVPRWSPRRTWTTRWSGCPAPATFGPQKEGASREDVLLRDAALERFAGVLERDQLLPAGLAQVPGAGAAGGLGAAILAARGRCESGIGLVTPRSGSTPRSTRADLVSPGRVRSTTSPAREGVAGSPDAERDRGKPCVVVAGGVSTGRREADAAA